MILIPIPPCVPSSDWLTKFADALQFLKPSLTFDSAMRCAMLAHTATWLLAPDEAAELWLAALEAAARERVSRGLLG